MTTPRYAFHAATIKVWGQEKTFALGGRDAGYTNSVEEWDDETSTWKEADPLSDTRGWFGIVEVPKALICPAI